jgi:hypothetical protein
MLAGCSRSGYASMVEDGMDMDHVKIRDVRFKPVAEGTRVLKRRPELDRKNHRRHILIQNSFFAARGQLAV